MSLNQRPEIDRFSLNDDSAKRAFTDHFNQNEGFIAREQTPDKGSDYLVELISSESYATNHHFAVQLKSIEKPVFIDNGAMISYAFKTSRLGYLTSNVPVYSLLIFYDISSKILYYDFSDKIYTRLRNERNDDSWEDNDTVNVKIPVLNMLDRESVKDIHQEFTKRYKQAKIMQQSHGHHYGLPVLKTNFDDEYDLHNLEHVKAILKRLGISSTAMHDMTLMYELLAKVPVREIEEDKDLLLISCIAYAEVGKLSESMFYINKLEKKFQISDDQRSMITFVKLKNQLNLGLINARSFVDQARKLEPDVEGIENKVTLRLNLVFFDLLNLKRSTVMPLSLAFELQKLNADIESFEDSISKYKFKVWNAEALSLYINHQRHQAFKEIEVKEALGVEIEMEERLQKANYIMQLHRLFLASVNEVLTYAKSKSDTVLQSVAIDAIVKYYLDWDLQLIEQQQSPDKDDQAHEKQLIHYVKLGLFAFNEFQAHRLMQSAYSIMCNLLELLHITRERYNFMDDLILDELVEARIALENELDLNPYELRAPNLVKEAEMKRQPPAQHLDYVKDYSDGDIEYLAEMVMNSGKFPNAKKENLLHELYSSRLFYQRCTDPDIDFMVKYPPTDQTAYIEPLRFVLIRKSNQQISGDNTNMDELLNSWRI